MKHIIQIKPSGYLLFVEDGQTVLDAALEANYEFPYSCGSATCGTCMGKVISGSFTYDGVEPYALDENAQEEGFALFCSVKPTSDMVIELEDVYGPEYIPVRKADFTVDRYHVLGNDVYQVFLKAKKKSIDYNAGQYLKIICDENIPLPYSIANAPSKKGRLELHIKAVADNPYTSEIINKIKNGDTITARGPYGKVMLQNELADLPIIFVAGGTGIVPIKALIEQAIANNDQRVMHLYWGAASAEDLYLQEPFSQLAEQHDNFSYTPIINNSEEYWQGCTGLVHEIVAHEHDDLSGHQVYASGPQDMVYAALDTFTGKGLKPQLMFSDTFEYFPREN